MKDKKPSPAAKLAEKLKPHLLPLGYSPSEAIDAFNHKLPEFVLCTLTKEASAEFKALPGKHKEKKDAWRPRLLAAAAEVSKHTRRRVVADGGVHLYIYF